MYLKLKQTHPIPFIPPPTSTLIWPLPRVPVGGMEVPENKLAISPPYMALIGLAAIAVVFAKWRKR